MGLFDDANKTELTKLVTAAACNWLDGRGFKPVETEVAIDAGWVADVASVIVPTETELQDLKLIGRKPAWKRPIEERDAWGKQADALKNLMTALVEVKTSRNDFCGDKKWTLPAVANLQWLAVPAGLIGESEWPEGWGILEYREAAQMLYTLRVPRANEVAINQQLSVVYEIACRRDHHTRYERIRQLQREQRNDQNERVSVTRVNSAISLALAIAHGRYREITFDSLESAIRYFNSYQFRIAHPPHWMQKEFDALWRIATPVTGELQDSITNVGEVPDGV